MHATEKMQVAPIPQAMLEVVNKSSTDFDPAVQKQARTCTEANRPCHYFTF